ncbi:ArgS-related anticodon-binding protein NrtL [Streptomyces corynorhini]|uniref:arginine--tRNA ligase n=1 Tax=Streptomyces corynorhini TaxID=2282652 RepID=A0A370BCT6_9ACTN|nr:DALR anticodon-binding domain-containing protein [Streptomyces corynorhini]RDG38482.1 arginine--tRNA ligase [Streptomyces corynorhini]
MTPAELSRTVRHALCRAVADDALPGPVPDRVVIERPGPGGSGDYATGVALRLAGPAGRPPREVAEILRGRVEAAPGAAGAIARVEITGPGFLNFTLADDSRDRLRADLVRAVRRDGARYGHGTALAAAAPARFAPAAETRAQLWTRTAVALLRTQGAAADIVPGAAETLRPAPAPAGDHLARLGPDALRWALLRPAAHDRPYTGPRLLVQRESNPLFRVRYAHARARALARGAADLGITPGYERGEETHTGLLTALGDHPAVLEAAARLRAPDRLARHLEQTAETFLRFQETARPLPLGDEKPSAAHRSRLALAAAAGAVLAGGLSLLGIDAPEHL